MKKLVSTSEASKILGISIQGVHYRIKKNQLESIKEDGKIFVYIDKKTPTNTSKITAQDNNSELIDVKNEQILLLKKTIKWMKKQYTQEIKRLDANQNKIIDVFKSEITLLQQAYNEMQNMYKIEQKTTKENSLETISIKDFFILMKNNNKTDTQIKTIILDRIKSKDRRFNYNKTTKELLITKSNFNDLI